MDFSPVSDIFTPGEIALWQEYWPSMTQEQRSRLQAIVDAHRCALEALERKYGTVMTDEQKVEGRLSTINEMGHA
jgi:hypothetical protein